MDQNQGMIATGRRKPGGPRVGRSSSHDRRWVQPLQRPALTRSARHARRLGHRPLRPLRS